MKTVPCVVFWITTALTMLTSAGFFGPDNRTMAVITGLVIMLAAHHLHAEWHHE